MIFQKVTSEELKKEGHDYHTDYYQELIHFTEENTKTPERNDLSVVLVVYLFEYYSFTI